MALEDELCKGLQRSLVRAPVLLLRPFRSSSGHCLMLLPAASLSHPGRALGLLEAPSGDCLSISLSKGTGTEALMFNVDLEGTVFLYSTPVSHKHCRLRCWFPAPPGKSQCRTGGRGFVMKQGTGETDLGLGKKHFSFPSLFVSKLETVSLAKLFEQIYRLVRRWGHLGKVHRWKGCTSSTSRAAWSRL